MSDTTTWRAICTSGDERAVKVSAPTGDPKDGSFAKHWIAEAPDDHEVFCVGRTALLAIAKLADQEGWSVVEVVPDGAMTADERVAAMREACIAEMSKLRDAFAETDKPRTPDYIRRHGWPPSVHVGDCIVHVRNIKESR